MNSMLQNGAASSGVNTANNVKVPRNPRLLYATCAILGPAKVVMRYGVDASDTARARLANEDMSVITTWSTYPMPPNPTAWKTCSGQYMHLLPAIHTYLCHSISFDVPAYRHEEKADRTNQGHEGESLGTSPKI